MSVYMQRLHMRVSATAAASGQVKTMRPAAAKIPTTFNRLVGKRVGKSFAEVAEVVRLPIQMPGEGEVLIQIEYAGINGGCETFRTRGEHWFKENMEKETFNLGAEGAGTVVAVGEGVQGLQAGQLVGFNMINAFTEYTEGQLVACNMGNAFTEYSVCKAFGCTPVSNLSAAEAVAVTLSGLTAAGTGKIQAGEVVAVTAAAGGTGHFAVQLALLKGCSVVAICGGDNKTSALLALAERMGYADKLSVINYKTQDLDQQLTQLCPKGIDCVYEGVGGPVRDVLLNHMTDTGRMLQVGYISEYPHVASDVSSKSDALKNHSDLPTTEELFWKGQNIDRKQQKIISKIWPSDPVEIKRCKQLIFQLAEEGKVKALVDESHGFQGVAGVTSAIEYMLKGGHVGKVVIPIKANQ
eukprot:gene14643-20679_t